MTDTDIVLDKKPLNFKENDLLGLFEDDFDAATLKWFDRTLYLANLDLTSADTTVQVARILLKMFSVYTLRETKRSIYTRSVNYNFSNRLEICTRLIQEHGFHLIGEHLDDHVLANDDMLVLVFDNGYINCFSGSPQLNENVFHSLNDLFFQQPPPEPNKGWLLESSGGGFEFRKYTVKERQIIEENYAASVVEQLPNLYSVVSSDEPLGRLAIMSGPPGGGKSSLIRGLMHRFTGSKFCIIPPYLVTNISSPAMISSVVRFQMEDPRPLILVLEDADCCLESRDRGNNADISAVLNLADGIFTDTFDVRVLATTNAPISKLDSALVRQGRLGAYLEVGGLDPVQVASIYRRLVKNDSAHIPDCLLDKKEIMLSDVYALVSKEEFVKGPSSTRKAIGFS